MKLRKFERALLILAVAAVFFTVGYFAGRERGGDVNVTVTQEAPAPTGEPEDGEGLVDLNTATRWELMSLPGIGEVLADRIIEYRTTSGPFRAPEELMGVQGIGESLFDSLSALITV